MYSTMSRLAVLLSLLVLLILASCGGGGGDNFPIDQGGQVLLASGAGVVFPAGTFDGPVEVTVTEDIPGEARAATAFPADAGNLLGALQVTVPAGVELGQNIEVRIAVGDSWDAAKGLVIFSYNPTTGMWETTEAASSAARGTTAVGTVKDSNVVSFTAATAGQTGFDQVYGVFDGYTTDVGGGGGEEPNTVPTVELAADDTTVETGATVNLTATGADADQDPLTFTWLAPGGALGAPATTGNTSTATWSAAEAGVYTVSVSVNDGNGGVATDAVSITVGNPPAENLDPVWEDGAALDGDVTAPVLGQAIKLTGAHATDPEGEAVTYEWTGPGAFTGEQDDEEHGFTILWTPAATGDATAVLTASDGVNEITLEYTIAIEAYPTAFDFVGPATCIACHNGKGDATAGTGWFNTSHAAAVENEMSNSHFARNESCNSCHAMGWGATGYGQGFIDFELTPEYANVGCEACHSGGATPGMGAGHKNVIWDPTSGMLHDEGAGTWAPDPEYDLALGVGCVRCHQGTRHGAGTEWVNSGHANFALTEEDEGNPGTFIVNHTITSAACSRCHSGKQFAVIHRGDEPLDLSGLTIDDPLEEHLITCAACHDPHNAQYEAQLRTDSEGQVGIPFSDTDNVPTMVSGGRGNICIECHNGRRDRGDYDGQVTNGAGHFGPHGNPQGAMFFGLMGGDLGVGAAVGSTTYESDHPHLNWNENTCITCHMYNKPYVSSDDPALHGHEFTPRFERCITCHTNFTADDSEAFWTWVEDYQTNEIGGLLAEFEAVWPAAWKDSEEALVSVESSVGAGDGPPADDPEGNAYRAALWNYELVLNDATHGVHNPTFSNDLLEKAIASVEALNAL